METLTLLIILTVIGGVVFLIRNINDSDESTPPTPTPTPTPSEIPEVDKRFAAFSFAREPSNDIIDTKIKFTADGVVLSNSFINGQMVENQIGIWNIDDFESGSIPTFEVSNRRGANFTGPAQGSMNESPEWVLSLEPRVGFQSASFILTLSNGTTTRIFDVLLSIEVPDLRL